MSQLPCYFLVNTSEGVLSLKNLTIGQLVNKFCAFYITRMLIDFLHKDLPLATDGSPPESILEMADSNSA
jgi:hypothetical protein